MSVDDHNFDRRLRDKLLAAGPVAPAALWDRIEAQLPAPAPRRRRRGLLLAWCTAGLLLGGTAAVVTIREGEDSSTRTEHIVSTLQVEPLPEARLERPEHLSARPEHQVGSPSPASQRPGVGETPPRSPFGKTAGAGQPSALLPGTSSRSAAQSEDASPTRPSATSLPVATNLPVGSASATTTAIPVPAPRMALSSRRPAGEAILLEALPPLSLADLVRLDAPGQAPAALVLPRAVVVAAQGQSFRLDLRAGLGVTAVRVLRGADAAELDADQLETAGADLEFSPLNGRNPTSFAAPAKGTQALRLTLRAAATHSSGLGVAFGVEVAARPAQRDLFESTRPSNGVGSGAPQYVDLAPAAVREWRYTALGSYQRSFGRWTPQIMAGAVLRDTRTKLTAATVFSGSAALADGSYLRLHRRVFVPSAALGLDYALADRWGVGAEVQLLARTLSYDLGLRYKL